MLRGGKAQRVTGIDLSREMMRIGEEKISNLLPSMGRQGGAVDFLYANAQEMPFEDDSFDGVTCAFGCRNFSDLDAGLREMYRVLRPGGQVTILEFSYPSNKLIRWGYDLYFSHVLPFVGRLVSRDKTAYTYLNRSVKSFCWGEEFLRHLTQAGFQDARFETLTFGIATIYVATRNP
jgi:demethylmenaquinone methyltransferase/2-methoxy-6-polyprenyl-1,4-benzoquinol methylase